MFGRAVLSVSQIARRARLHLATASRLIAELESHGLLDREPDRRVRVGVRMRELALRARSCRSAPRPGPWSGSSARRPAGSAGRSATPRRNLLNERRDRDHLGRLPPERLDE
jgi:hypothetical protein